MYNLYALMVKIGPKEVWDETKKAAKGVAGAVKKGLDIAKPIVRATVPTTDGSLVQKGVDWAKNKMKDDWEKQRDQMQVLAEQRMYEAIRQRKLAEDRMRMPQGVTPTAVPNSYWERMKNQFRKSQ